MNKCILVVPNPMIKNTLLLRKAVIPCYWEMFSRTCLDVSETFHLDFMVLGDVSALHLSKAWNIGSIFQDFQARLTYEPQMIHLFEEFFNDSPTVDLFQPFFPGLPIRSNLSVALSGRKWGYDIICPNGTWCRFVALKIEIISTSKFLLKLSRYREDKIPL